MNNNQDTINLLKEIHQGSQMGIESIDELLKKVDDKSFKNDLISIQNEYKGIATTANNELQKFGATPHETGLLEKMQLWTATNMHTIASDDTPHLADMIVNGENMGIKQISKAINNNPNADQNTKNFGNQYIDLMQKQVQQIRKYLH